MKENVTGEETKAERLARLIGEHPGWPVVVMSDCVYADTTSCFWIPQGVANVCAVEVAYFGERCYDEEGDFVEAYVDAWCEADSSGEELAALEAKARKMWRDNALSVIAVYSTCYDTPDIEELG